MNRNHQIVIMYGLAAMAVVAFMLLPFPAWAQQTAKTCTYNPDFKIQVPASGTGIISLLVQNISLIINYISAQLYNSLIGNPSFQLTIRLAGTLYIVLYGVMFTFGMSQISLMDFVIRMIKLGIIAMLLSPMSYGFFYGSVGVFFNQGTDWLIGVMAQIAVGTVPGLNPTQPFAVLDNAIAVLTSSKMAVTLIATFFTGPYGLLFGLLILMGMGTFGAALMQAMWVYLMSLVVKAFLFAMAPVFFAFLLFQRTRNLFDGWLNQIIAASLQPIFLFTFFAFFAKLIEASMHMLLRVPVCWTPPGELWQGSPFDISMWRFMLESPPGSNNFFLYNGAWSFTGTDFGGAPFPISIIDLLIFVILVQLAWRFNGIATKIANDIASASLNLNISGGLSGLLDPTKASFGGLGKQAEAAAGGAAEAAKVAQGRAANRPPTDFIPKRSGPPTTSGGSSSSGGSSPPTRPTITPRK